MSKRTAAVILALMTSLGVTPSAWAEMLTFSVTHPVVLAGSTPFVFPGFSSDLGTLEAVDLSLSAAATSVGGLFGFNGDFVSPAPFVVPGRLTLTHFLSFPPGGVALLSVVQTDTSVTIEPVPFAQTRLFAPFDMPAAVAGPVSLTSPTALDFFTQEGDVTLIGSGFFQTTPLRSDTGVFGVPNTLVPVTATLTYQFTPVPEPSTLTLLAIGTLGLLGYGWRRRKQA